MKDDHDLIDSALDAAEATIKPTEEPAVKDTPEKIEGVDEETTEAPAVVEEPISDQDANAETPTEAQAQTPEAAAEPDVEAPAHWTAEKKALFSTASKELKQAIVERELTLQQLVSRTANEAQRGKAIEQRLNADFSSPEELAAHKAQLKLVGVNDEVDELHRYRAWNRVLKHDPVTVINALMKEHGLTAEELNGEILSDDQLRSIDDPRIDEVVNDFRSLKEQLEAEKKEREELILRQEVEAFRSEKDSHGEPRARFATAYAPQIDNVYQQIIQYNHENGIQMSVKDALSHAYDHVQKEVYALHGIVPKSQQPVPKTPEQIKAQTKKAMDAASVVSGTPRTDTITEKPRRKAKNDKELVDNAVDRALNRMSA